MAKEKKLGNISIKGFNEANVKFISSAVQATLNDVIDCNVSPAIGGEEIWIDFRCTQEELEQIKTKLQNELIKVEGLNYTIHAQEKI